MLRQETILDFVCSIGICTALAFWYIQALRSPDRNRMTRALNRYHEFWSRSGLSFVRPVRAQMFVLLAVTVLIGVGALVLLIVELAEGRLP
jgi:ABC-type amino acid transport system permease subunit